MTAGPLTEKSSPPLLRPSDHDIAKLIQAGEFWHADRLRREQKEWDAKEGK